MERCELITYLGAKMTRKYKEPQFRAIDFDHKLQTFLSLRNIDPVNGQFAWATATRMSRVI